MTLNMVSHLFFLLCLFALPMVVEGENLCIVYTMIGQGSNDGIPSQGFDSEKWYKVHRLFDRNTNASIAAEGRNFLQFFSEWYGISLDVGNDTLSGVVPNTLYVEASGVRLIFRLTVLPDYANYRLYSESRGHEVRFYRSKVCIVGWMIYFRDEFTVTTGRNQGMVIPARSAVRSRVYYIKPGGKGFDNEIKLQAEDRVPILVVPMPLGQDAGYETGSYSVSNPHVTSLTRPEFGVGRMRGITTRYKNGTEYVVGGRLVFTFRCGNMEDQLP
ncbi:uncharacterized protein LOC106172988 isoform X4 [Lingula anatina]|uniref:Uncharacterized protein LOC106172988 isoform X4 n=1 Tax=Lingula anatina TaxID=7574 RepID=A0A1S3JG70_LINAN|nr:uncharacterized protein LOC106172988 isoform X4 [Lingula anatina]|eukprot:XP_013409405.1 uncharacterized protein LOC106172988 isoform X4 [Lingula anatina]